MSVEVISLHLSQYVWKVESYRSPMIQLLDARGLLMVDSLWLINQASDLESLTP